MLPRHEPGLSSFLFQGDTRNAGNGIAPPLIRVRLWARSWDPLSGGCRVHLSRANRVCVLVCWGGNVRQDLAGGQMILKESLQRNEPAVLQESPKVFFHVPQVGVMPKF